MKNIKTIYKISVTCLIMVLTLAALFISAKVDKNTHLKAPVSFASRMIAADEGITYNTAHPDKESLEIYIYNRLHKSQVPHNQTMPLTKLIMQESEVFHIDPLFILSMMIQESRLRPNMRGSHGEYGLMQILPETAKWIAKRNNINIENESDLLNPLLNVKLGIRYFMYLNQKFNDVQLATSAYNMGARNVYRLLAKNTRPAIYFNGVSSHYQTAFFQLYGFGVEKTLSNVAVR